VPDLFTHFAAARVPAAFLRDRRHQALVLAGTFLPDIGSKGLYWVAQAPERFAAPSHSLVGLLLLCYLAALFLEQPLRRAGFACLYAGALLHLFLDLLKENLGIGSLRPFLPFSPAAIEFGWIPSEDVVLLLPLDIGVLLLAWILEKKRRRA
jgi:hypothetical protein